MTAFCNAVRSPRVHHPIVMASIFALASLASTSVFAQERQVDQQKTTISGVVVNSVTHAPIGRALVSSGDNRYAMLTDSTGHFEFELTAVLGVPADSVVYLSARKPGFLNEGNQGINATPGQEVTLTLIPESLIVGRVTLTTGDAPTGLAINLFYRQTFEGLPRWMPRSVAQPNSSGEFRFADLPPGSYKLLTSEMLDRDPNSMVPSGPLYGYPPAYYLNAADFAAASTIELTAGQTVQADFALTHQPYYPVKIPVIGDVNGLGMMVNVSLQGHKGPGYSLGYNPLDHKIEGLLPNGNYMVTATTQLGQSVSGATNIKVAGAPIDGPAMNLIPSNSISFNVREEFTNHGETPGQAGSILGSTQIQIRNGFDRRHPSHGPALYLQPQIESADDFAERVNASLRPPLGPNDESKVLQGIPPGRYWLRLHSGRGYVAAATMGTTDVLHQPVVIGPGSTASVDVVMRDDYASIEGSVSGLQPATAGTDAWTPPAWISCAPLPDSSGGFQQLPIQSDGRFNFTLPPGSYRVLAFQHQHPDLPYRDPEAMRPFENKGQVIHLEANQKVSLQLQLISGDESGR
jgi:hypothetical protein